MSMGYEHRRLLCFADYLPYLAIDYPLEFIEVEPYRTVIYHQFTPVNPLNTERGSKTLKCHNDPMSLRKQSRDGRHSHGRRGKETTVSVGRCQCENDRDSYWICPVLSSICKSLA